MGAWLVGDSSEPTRRIDDESGARRNLTCPEDDVKMTFYSNVRRLTVSLSVRRLTVNTTSVRSLTRLDIRGFV